MSTLPSEKLSAHNVTDIYPDNDNDMKIQRILRENEIYIKSIKCCEKTIVESESQINNQSSHVVKAIDVVR